MSRDGHLHCWCNFSLEMVTVASSPRPANLDSSLEVDTETDYLKIAKKGGGHKGCAINLINNNTIHLST